MSDPAAQSDSLFDTIAVVGVGMIGGSIAGAAKQGHVANRVIGVGRSVARLEAAVERGLIDECHTDLATVAREADLIVFCTPVDRIVEGVRNALPHCQPGSVMTDAGSVKAEICAELAGCEFPEGVTFVGSHPLAGSEQCGNENADAELFRGRVCVVTPGESIPQSAVRRVSQFWQALGMTVLERSPEEHDRLLAVTSHLPHAVAAALASLLDENNREFAASGFRDTTRIAASDPALWAAILHSNSAAVSAAMDGFLSVLHAFRDSLADRDVDRLQELFQQSKTNRDALDRT